MKIAVLAGGFSPERDVSLSSGSLIANALAEDGHEVLLIDSYFGAVLDKSGHAEDLFQKNVHHTYTVPETEPDLDALRQMRGSGDELFGKNVIELCQMADVTFLALHGGSGENGQVQAVLDSYGIRYTGSGYVGSLLAMDKELTKKLLSASGIPVPVALTAEGGKTDPAEMMQIEEQIGYPCVVKPCSGGSSVGISMVNNRTELEKALILAGKYENKVLVEKRIVGREFTMAVFDGKTLPPVEIIPKTGFYDYKNKYQKGLTDEICPADISEEACKCLGEQTLRAFQVLHLRDYARFDYICDEKGVFWCLEANSLPGMTPTSLLPREAAAVGISYPALCSRIARLAFERG